MDKCSNPLELFMTPLCSNIRIFYQKVQQPVLISLRNEDIKKTYWTFNCWEHFLFNKTHNQFLQTYCQPMNIWKEGLDRMKPTLRSCPHSLTTYKCINYKQHITTPKSTEPHKAHQKKTNQQPGLYHIFCIIITTNRLQFFRQVAAHNFFSLNNEKQKGNRLLWAIKRDSPSWNTWLANSALNPYHSTLNHFKVMELVLPIVQILLVALCSSSRLSQTRKNCELAAR